MQIMSQIFRRLGRWGVILALWCSLANGASAAEKDWLDEMPSVPAVIQAVREQVELARQQNPALAKDEDFLAEDIVGTFVLLRWVMDMQSDKEWYTSEERRKRMRGIEMGYMQVELAIGLGVGERNGHIKDNCDPKDSYLNRLGQKIHATPVECYQHRFHVALSNVYPSFNHRNAIFPLLFCDRARYYLDLVQEQVRKTPPPRRTPAQTLSLPDGMRPLGLAVCEHYGYDSDRNKNGLCDDWEKPINSSGTSALAAVSGCSIVEAPSAATRVTLGRVTKIDPSTVRVEFTRADKSATGPILFKLTRYNLATQKSTGIAITTQIIRPAPIGGGTEFALLTASPADLEPDPNMPWLVSVASANGIDSNKVWCKQHVPVPPVDQALKDPHGFFGPYKTADEAAMAAEPTARAMTVRSGGPLSEVGVLIVPGPSSGGVYYVTTFVGGTGFGKVTEEDYVLSFDNSNKFACQPFYGDTVRIAGTAHTHPPSTIITDENKFSDLPFPLPSPFDRFFPNDMDQAYKLRKMENSTFERIYLFRPDRCIDSFDGRKGNPVIPVGCNK